MTTVQSAGPETKAAGARARAQWVESESELHPFHAVNGQSHHGAWGSGQNHPSRPPAAHPLARLHRTLGNQAVLRTLSLSRPAIQTKLAINQPGDQYEEEADRVAEQVMRMPEARRGAASPLSLAAEQVQRKCACGGTSLLGETCGECSSSALTGKSEPLIQPKLKVNQPGDSYEQEADRVAQLVTGAPGPDSQAESARAREEGHNPGRGAESLGQETLRRGGVPLPLPVRDFYESRFGYDFSMVRLHTGPAAENLNQQLQAHAFTFAEHIWLGERQRPERSYVMAHELAHVIQQRQPPRSKRNTPEIIGVHLPGGVGEGGHSVQRLPFFVPIDTRLGKLETGRQIHVQILHQFNTGPILIEAPVPNAIRKGEDVWGFNIWGVADLYRSSNGKTVGIYFTAPPKFTGERETRGMPKRSIHPARHPRANQASSSPRFAEPDEIVDISEENPQTIWLNELKPANQDFLTAGIHQLTNYQKGFNLAKDQTNAWAARQKPGRKPWKLKVIINQPVQSAVEPKPIEKKQLAVADVDPDYSTPEHSFKVKKIWVPRRDQRMPGKLRVQYHDQSGIWLYWARPDDLAAAFNLPSPKDRAKVQRAMFTALIVQEEVIKGLGRTPHEIISPFRKEASPDVSTPPLQSPVIQRKDQRPARLDDKFDLNKWNTLRANIKRVVEEDRVVDPAALAKGDVGATGGDAFDYLKSLELAVKAEENLEAAGEKSEFLHSPELKEVKSLTAGGTSPTAPKLHKTPLELYSWLHRWTSNEVGVFGIFRAKFARAFVGIANFVAGHTKGGKEGLIAKIGRKLKAIFESLSSKKGGSALANLAIKGITKAIEQLSGLLLPAVIKMVWGAIKAGIWEKVGKIFDVDVAAIEEKIADFTKWVKTIDGWFKAADVFEDLESLINTVTGVLDTLNTIRDTFQKIVDYISTAADLIETGIELAECSGVISCLLVLFKSAEDWAIEKFGQKVLNSCGARYLIAKGLYAVFSSLPRKLAEGILNLLHDHTPAVLGDIREIFAGPVPEEDLQDPDEIVDDDCWSIDLGFSLGGFKHSPKEKGKLGEKAKGDQAEKLEKLAESLDAEKAKALARLMQKMGITDDTPLSDEDVQKLQNALQNVNAKEMKDAAEGKAGADTAGKLKPLTDALGEMAKKTKPAPKPSPTQPAKPPAPARPAPQPGVTPPPVPARPAPQPGVTPPPAPARPAPQPGIAPPAAPEPPAPTVSTQQPAWDNTQLEIWFQEGRQNAPRPIYRESRLHHERMSDEKPKHLFHLSCLGGATFSVFFLVGNRPEPFRRPSLKVSWKVAGTEHPFSAINPKYVAALLEGSFGPAVRVDPDLFRHVFAVYAQDKDILEITIMLIDEDSATTLTYQDHAEVVVDTCA